MIRVLPLAATLLLTLGLTAQRTWTVDAQSGPGTDFTDVPPALAAASHGDVIMVRGPGAYSVFSTSKGVSIFCLDGVQFFGFDFVVDGVPAGRQFAIKGLNASWGRFYIRNCQGRVLLDRVQFYPLLVVENCTQVQIHGSHITGKPALRATRSTLAISDTILEGASYVHPTDSFRGAECTDSTLIFARGMILGGNGGEFALGKPALVTTRTALELRGDATTIVRAGASSGMVQAIDTTGGTVLLDPRVSVLPTNGALPLQGSAKVTIQRVPALLATGALLGGVVHGDLFAEQGQLAVFFVGLAADALSAPPYGTLWWDMNGPWALTGMEVVGASEHVTHDLPVPMDRALVGPVFVRQAMTLSVSGPWLLSNPTSYVIH